MSPTIRSLVIPASDLDAAKAVYTATNKATGRSINVRVAHHYVVRGGLIVPFEQFVDTAAVRTAMDPITD